MPEVLDQLRKRLKDRYEVQQEIGRGGMAVVYLATDLKHHRNVAIKVLRPELMVGVGSERFVREIEIAAALNHPHILSLFDSGESDGLFYYVMPYVEGESLRDRISRENQLPIEEAIHIATQVASAISYADSLGLVHRDVKPENILLHHGEALVADFGIARALSEARDERLTTEGQALGTAAYMSPEQASGQDIDGRSDIYSLSCVLYEMLTGEPPFAGRNTQAIIARHAVEEVASVRIVRPTVPQYVDNAVRKALAKVPADRYSTATDFGAALVGREPEEIKPDRSPYRSISKTGVIAVVSAVTIIVGVFTGLRILQENPFMQSGSVRYSDSPAFSDWEDLGPYNPLSVFVVADSHLIVGQGLYPTLHAFNGQRWTRISNPDSLIVVPHAGVAAGSRLLGRKQQGGLAGQSTQWLVEVTNGSVRAADSLPYHEGGLSWWSDGINIVSSGMNIARLESGEWVRENLGTAARLVGMWGSHVDQRYGVLAGRDTLLVYDGIAWERAVIRPDWAAGGRVSYARGASLGDGASAILGYACDSISQCQPWLLEQDTFGGGWTRGAGGWTRWDSTGVPGCRG